jgi:hypothetical protein
MPSTISVTPRAPQVDQHIEAAAVRHAQHHIGDTAGAGPLHQFVEQGHECIPAFQREAFLAGVLAVQIALEPLGRCQVAEQFNARLRGVLCGPVAVARLQSLLDPAALVGGRDVHVLARHRATVHPLEDSDDLAQRPGVDWIDGHHRDRLFEACRVQSVVFWGEFGRAFPIPDLQRIDIRRKVAEHTVGHDQLPDTAVRVLLRPRPARHLTIGPMLEAVKIVPPLG